MRRFRNQILSAMGLAPATTVLIALSMAGCGDSDKPDEPIDDDQSLDADLGGAEDGLDMDGPIGPSDGDGDTDGDADADDDDTGSEDGGSEDDTGDDPGDEGGSDDDTDGGDGGTDDGTGAGDGGESAGGTETGGTGSDDGPDAGSECTTPGDADGFYDCEGRCLPTDPYFTWLGDGTCDDGSRGIVFSCGDLAWDNGDCDVGTDDAGGTGGGTGSGTTGGSDDGGDLSCADAPDLTGTGWSPWDPYSPEPFMVCQPLPERGDWSSCPTSSGITAWSLLYGYFVGMDAWGDARAVVTCGPEAARTDACCYTIEDFEYYEIAVGRPFTIGGQARLSPTVSDNGWSECSEWLPSGMTDTQRERLIAHWTETAQFEHASVASFARFTMQLMAVGAPADLVAEATRAQGDEIRHARICLGIASTLADETIGLGALPIDGALEDAGSIEAILVDTIKEACVNETVSAAICHAAGEAASDSFIREALITIAEDEQRHSTLAWRTVQWMLNAHPELRDLARATFEEAMAQPWASSTEATGDLTPWGVMSRAQEQAVASRVMRRVVRPCVDALLGTERTVMANT